MGIRPRTKYVLKLKARRCSRCGGRIGRHQARCTRCNAQQARPKK